MGQLPLSESLRVAISDLRMCAGDPRYVVDFSVWHQLREDGTCAVCLVGAYLANSLGYSRSTNVASLRDYGHSLLAALDLVRQGDLTGAVLTWTNENEPAAGNDLPLLSELRQFEWESTFTELERRADILQRAGY